MITHTCANCAFHFTQADKAWDKAIATGHCPKCHEHLPGFTAYSPVLEKQHAPQDEQEEVGLTRLWKHSPSLFILGLINALFFMLSWFSGVIIVIIGKKPWVATYAQSPGAFAALLGISAIFFLLSIRGVWRSYA